MDWEETAITRSHRLDSTNAYIHQGGFRTIISTAFRALDSDPVWAGSAGTDNILSFTAMHADGDLIISVGWGDGFGVQRVADDGTVSSLYRDNTPNNSYAYYASLAVDKVRGLAFVGNHVYDNLRKYDYSGVQSGGAGSVTDEGQLTEAGNNLPSDEVGYNYFNGLEIVGDYLYIICDDKSATTQLRWNTQTETADNITVVNVRNAGRYGSVFYFEDNNRIYSQWHRDGEIWVTTNPESATPTAKTYCIRINALGIGDDCMFIGIIEDKNDPNQIWVCGAYNFAKIDITNCIKDVGFGNPTLVSSTVSPDLRFSPYWLSNSIGIRFWAEHPKYKSDFIRIYADRGFSEKGGWWDQENEMPVCPIQNGYISSDRDNLFYDYQARPVLVTTNNGTQYWVYGGYSHDGHSWHVFNYEDGLVLYDSSSIIFGTYQMTDTSNVKRAFVLNLDGNVYTLSQTNISFFLSNDNGSTWEHYVPGRVHEFATTGNQVRFRINMQGTEIKSSHIQLDGDLVMLLSNDDENLADSKKRFTKMQGA